MRHKVTLDQLVAAERRYREARQIVIQSIREMEALTTPLISPPELPRWMHLRSQLDYIVEKSLKVALKRDRIMDLLTLQLTRQRAEEADAQILPEAEKSSDELQQ